MNAAIALVTNTIDRMPAGDVRTISLERLGASDSDELVADLRRELGAYATFSATTAHLTVTRKGAPPAESVLPEITVPTAAKLPAALKSMRKRRGLSLHQCATPAGMTSPQLSGLEHGRAAKMGVATLLRVMEVLGYELVLRPKAS